MTTTIILKCGNPFLNMSLKKIFDKCDCRNATSACAANKGTCLFAPTSFFVWLFLSEMDLILAKQLAIVEQQMN